MNILLTGASGFIGTNLRGYLGDKYSIVNYKKNSPIIIRENAVIHLAGKAHDLKNTGTPNEYYEVNTELTKILFDAFLVSKAKLFVTLSSVKAVADKVNGPLFEDTTPNPITHYGKSKLLAEQYILSKPLPEGKYVYILRPCMIHGPGNKGNLNLLYNLVSMGLFWPFGAFANFRSFLSIENLCFIIKELLDRDDIPSGVYNVADDEPLSINEVIETISETKDFKINILNLNKSFIKFIARIGDFLKLPINSERLQKITESYVVCNAKLKAVLGKPLPVSSKNGLLITFKSFAESA